MTHFVRQSKPLPRFLSNSRIEHDVSARNPLDAEQSTLVALGGAVNHFEPNFADDIRQSPSTVIAEAAKKRLADK
jgi:hypothetical protein